MRLDLDQISDSPNPVFVPLRTQCRRSAYAVCVCSVGAARPPLPQPYRLLPSPCLMDSRIDNS